MQAKDFVDPEVYHRHLSHLIGLYPGHTISMDKTPELAKAVGKSLVKRGTSITRSQYDQCVIHGFDQLQVTAALHGRPYGRSRSGRIFGTANMPTLWRRACLSWWIGIILLLTEDGTVTCSLRILPSRSTRTLGKFRSHSSLLR